MILKFNKNERAILTELCLIQIESYRIILENSLLKEDENILRMFNASLEDAEKEAKWRISQYKEMLETPNYLGILENSEILTLRHLLFHSEDIYISQSSEMAEAVSLLWIKFFMIEEERNPRTKLSTSLLKTDGNKQTKRKGIKQNNASH